MRLESLLRWTARIWGIASTLLLLAFSFGGREPLRFTPGEAVGFLLFPVGVVAGLAVAWWREWVGGIITVTSLALFGAYLFLWSGQWPNIYFFMFAAPGILHIASAWLASRHSNKRADSE
ncbi:MAG: hypothetical protein FJ405_08525 [Verrucomicrobia bacterium]|nr:hypothetical protein [Verrucomicrobiota bacterium]